MAKSYFKINGEVIKKPTKKVKVGKSSKCIKIQHKTHKAPKLLKHLETKNNI
jgi:hypothetical protein